MTPVADVAADRCWFVTLALACSSPGRVAWIDAMAGMVASAIVIGGSLVAGSLFDPFHAAVPGGWCGLALSRCRGIRSATASLAVTRRPSKSVLRLLLVMTFLIGGTL